MKIGGGNEESDPTTGIHCHMNINNNVTYYALDIERQIISYIEVERKDGTKSIYKAPNLRFPKTIF